MEKTAAPQTPSAPGRMTPAEARRAQKNERKNAAREAARKAAAARKRRNAILGGLAAVVIIVVAALLITNLGGKSDKKATASTASASPSAPTSPAASATTPAIPFPGVPAGADPALKTKPVVKKGTGTVSKLKVTTLIKGTGAKVKLGDSITVNYVGVTYTDGKEFDSSWKNSQTATFPLVQGGLIQGWVNGLPGVTVGSRVQLDIPKALAYPTATASSGQPVGDLRFVVDVLATGPATS